MLDAEDTAWLKATTNELNNLLQVISETSNMLAPKDNADEGAKYFAILRHGVERATSVARSMAERLGAAEAENVVPMPGAPALQVPAVAPASEAKPLPPSPATGPLVPPLSGNIKVFNPAGTLELVMVVDDEEFISFLAQRLLTDEGYRVITARDGFQAVEIYRKLRDQISLVILDFTMPVMDGADVFAELQEINPQVPVVLSSGFAEQGRLQTMLARGLRGFIPKPYTHQKLLSQVRSILDTIKAEQSVQRRIL
jgi:CheY-like chemotaxis protein